MKGHGRVKNIHIMSEIMQMFSTGRDLPYRYIHTRKRDILLYRIETHAYMEEGIAIYIVLKYTHCRSPKIYLQQWLIVRKKNHFSVRISVMHLLTGIKLKSFKLLISTFLFCPSVKAVSACCLFFFFFLVKSWFSLNQGWQRSLHSQ